MSKDSKIEVRTTEDEKTRWQGFARQAGYQDREFSTWVRRVLNGDELHPDYVEVAGERPRSRRR